MLREVWGNIFNIIFPKKYIAIYSNIYHGKNILDIILLKKIYFKKFGEKFILFEVKGKIYLISFSRRNILHYIKYFLT